MFETLTRRTRRTAAPALVVFLAAAAVAAGAAPIRVDATPRSVAHGQRLVLRGSGWGVIEYCKPRVTLALRRAAPLRDLPIATANLRTDPLQSGTFRTSWIVPATVHPGVRIIVATQHCESGKDGRAVLVTRSTRVRVS